jgi:hypothetical protein
MAIGLAVTAGVAIVYIVGGLLLVTIGRRFGSGAGVLWMAAVSLVLLLAFIELARPLDPAAPAILAALVSALPFVAGWILIGTLVLVWVKRRATSHTKQDF